MRVLFLVVLLGLLSGCVATPGVGHVIGASRYDTIYDDSARYEPGYPVYAAGPYALGPGPVYTRDYRRRVIVVAPPAGGYYRRPIAGPRRGVHRYGYGGVHHFDNGRYHGRHRWSGHHRPVVPYAAPRGFAYPAPRSGPRLGGFRTYGRQGPVGHGARTGWAGPGRTR